METTNKKIKWRLHEICSSFHSKSMLRSMIVSNLQVHVKHMFLDHIREARASIQNPNQKPLKPSPHYSNISRNNLRSLNYSNRNVSGSIETYGTRYLEIVSSFFFWPSFWALSLIRCSADTIPFMSLKICTIG